MGLFDRFKKQEPDYDPTNIKVTDLNIDFVFEYDLKTWQIEEVYEYDWGDNYFTREFKINSGDEIMYLSVEEDDELILSASSKIKIRAIDENLPEKIENDGRPPKKITYKNITFFLDEESPGYFHNAANDNNDWIELVSWDYSDENGEYVLCIEQWDDFEFDASFGKTIKEYEISNILPANN